MITILIINWLALLFSFFVVGCVLGVAFSPAFRRMVERVLQAPRELLFNRVSSNPIITPGRTPWELEAVMNPAAVVLPDRAGTSRTHLIYRAIGSDGVSRLGYASSKDGVIFDDRPLYPVFVSRDPHAHFTGQRMYSPVLYPSGGSWGGCEDPRMVAIDGRVYIIFNAFDNWNLRIGCISISEKDFLAKHWHWTPPHFLSQPNGRDKNWMLFPEKVHGKFAILHSIIADDCDHVLIEYADDIDTYKPAEHTFYSPDPQKMPDCKCAWHDRMRSAGPPPIKTDRGWLVFYHATCASEGNSRYKLGAMLLDLEDPTRVIYRANFPVLSPDVRYENDGKPGIIYACGAVVRDGILYLYYGGADKVVCVATAALEPFLNALVSGQKAELASQPTQTT